MTITIHRGTHQIGGCITEIKSDNARVFIDMGEVAKDIFLTLATRIKDDGEQKIRDFKTFKALDKIVIKDITVMSLLVDHSAFDAYMFLIESGDKRILHTGESVCRFLSCQYQY